MSDEKQIIETPSGPSPKEGESLKEHNGNKTTLSRSLLPPLLRRISIRTRLLVTFALLVLLPAAVIAPILIIGSLRSIQEQTINRLEAVVVLKETEIETWMQNLKDDLQNATVTDRVKPRWVLEKDVSDELRRQSTQILRDYLNSVILREQSFDEFMLMNLDGKVVVSTDVDIEGFDYSDKPFFVLGLEKPVVLPLLTSPSTGQITWTVARPVFDVEGERVIGVIVGRANQANLNDKMSERTELGETGETYLVGDNYALLTPLRTLPQDEEFRSFEIHTDGIDAAIATESNGSGLYNNYAGQPVAGAYRWIPELGALVLAEQEQAEAFRIIYSTALFSVLVTLAAVAAALFAAQAITRNIANPLSDLAETATQIAAGNLDRTAEVEREDEIGALALAFNTMTHQLRDLITNLERRVAERTVDLEHRAQQIQAAAEVGRAAASIRDLNMLLPQVTQLISERFGFYHAGIFLLDETEEYAVLRAANSPGGQRMLARHHRLKVGEQGIVGSATGAWEAHIALDVGEDAVYFDNPDLPETRSEMALPLIAGGELLGALDVQSTEAAAFTEEDITVLQTLADQVALAIHNARLLGEAQEALQAERRAYGEISARAWTGFLQAQQSGLGFRSDLGGVNRTADHWSPEMQQALQEGRVVLGNRADSGMKVALPVKVRGNVIGVLETYKPADDGDWTDEEIALLETLAEQLGAALESARLYQDAQRRAARERLTSEITDKMRRVTNVEGIIQTAVDELFEALGTSRAFVRLGVSPSARNDGEDGA